MHRARARVLASRSTVDGLAATARRDADESAVLRAFDAARCARAGRATRRMPQVPTLALYAAETLPSARLADDPLFATLRADERARWVRILGDVPPSPSNLARLRFRVAKQVAGALHRGGARLLAGTDAPMPRVYPGDSLHVELAALVDAGLSPAQALRAATVDAAREFGARDLGRIEAGARADLVLLDADPLADITAMRRIHAVVLGGRVLDRAALRTLVAPRPDSGVP